MGCSFMWTFVAFVHSSELCVCVCVCNKVLGKHYVQLPFRELKFLFLKTLVCEQWERK